MSSDMLQAMQRDKANIRRKIWRFKKQKNKPQSLLERLRDRDIPRFESEVDRCSAIVDLRDAHYGAVRLLQFLDKKGRRFRRSYAYEAFIEHWIVGRTDLLL
jgi:hypothetical protein